MRPRLLSGVVRRLAGYSVMTEAEWLGDDGEPMLEFLAGHPCETDRKLRLFAVACWRQAVSTYPLEAAEMEAVEEYADGRIDTDGLLAAHRAHYRHLFPGDPDSALSLVLDAGEYAYSEATRTAEARAAAAGLLRDIFGNPFRPVTFSPEWRTDTAVSLARQMYESRDFGAMPILADALQDAGCEDDDILSHCRDDGPHVRGCWVVDLVLGKG
jgi:hypothetical protein